MEQKPELQITLSDLVPVLIFALGGLYLISAGLCNRWVLGWLDADGQIAPEIVSNMVRVRWWLVSIGLALIGIGYLLYKKPLLQIKKPKLALFVIGGLGLWFLAELVLSIRPQLTTEARLAQSVSYKPTAYARHRLTEEAFEVKGAKGESRFLLYDGYRSATPIEPKQPGEVRMVILGGSFVFDPYAEGAGTDWPAQLQKQFQEVSAHKVTVINAGVPGHHTMDSIGRLLTEVHLLEPDLILLCHAWNDIKYFNRVSLSSSLLRSTKPLTKPSHDASSWIKQRIERSQVVLRIQALLQRSGQKVGLEGALGEWALADTVSAVGLRQFEIGVKTFVDLSRNIGATPVLVTQPRLVHQNNTPDERARIYYEYVELEHEALVEAFEACDRILKTVANDKSVFIVDLHEALNDESELFADHVHLNGEATSRIVAQKLITELADLILEKHGQ